MRTSGTLAATRGLGRHDHVCRPCDASAEFHAESASGALRPVSALRAPGTRVET